MNLKKILIVSLVILAIFSSMSVASAGFLEDLFGSAEEPEPYNVTVDGINFTIPGNFKENANVSFNDTGFFNSTVRAYEDSNKYIMITVDSYESLDDLNDALVFDSATNKTIGNKTGFFLNKGSECAFKYVNGTKIIDITTTDEKYLEQIIIYD